MNLDKIKKDIRNNKKMNLKKVFNYIDKIERRVMTEKILSVKEIALILRISERKVRGLVEKKTIPYFKIENKICFYENVVRAYFECKN